MFHRRIIQAKNLRLIASAKGDVVLTARARGSARRIQMRLKALDNFDFRSCMII